MQHPLDILFLPMDRRAFLLSTLVALATPVESLTSFDTNCTLPSHSFNYVQGPNTRGSLQIVWSCLATLFASTYTILHLSIPKQRDGRDGGYSRYLRTWWKRVDPSIVRATITATSTTYSWSEAADASPYLKRTLRMLKPKDKGATRGYWARKQILFEAYWWLKSNGDTIFWFFVTMLEPERYAYRAVRQYRSASACKIELERLRPSCHPTNGWSLTHTYFADMGGFVVHSHVGSPSPVVTRLTAESLLRLLQHDDCHQLIDCSLLPSEEELQDRSKSNAVTKTLVILQISWFVANCITRLARRLPTIQLEMGVLGTAVCSLVSYITLFQKPYAVKTVVAVLSVDGDIPGQIVDVLRENNEIRDSHRTGYSHRGRDTLATVVFTLLATVLGAFHVAAWNFSFPTELDKVMWRVNSVITCALMASVWILIALFRFVFVPVQHIFDTSHINWDQAIDAFMEVLFAPIFLLYVVSRMILAVLVIRFLFHIPPGAFQTSWADNLPHI